MFDYLIGFNETIDSISEVLFERHWEIRSCVIDFEAILMIILLGECHNFGRISIEC
jgi:hypothetical protein